MADIAASDVTYTVKLDSRVACPSNPRTSALVTVAFGNGTLTYPTGGVPLLGAKLGCPAKVEELEIEDAANGNGFVYKWDRANNKIRIYQVPALDGNSASAQALAELVGGTATPAAASLIVKVVGW